MTYSRARVTEAFYGSSSPNVTGSRPAITDVRESKSPVNESGETSFPATILVIKNIEVEKS